MHDIIVCNPGPPAHALEQPAVRTSECCSRFYCLTGGARNTPRRVDDERVPRSCPVVCRCPRPGPRTWGTPFSERRKLIGYVPRPCSLRLLRDAACLDLQFRDETIPADTRRESRLRRGFPCMHAET